MLIPYNVVGEPVDGRARDGAEHGWRDSGRSDRHGRSHRRHHTFSSSYYYGFYSPCRYYYRTCYDAWYRPWYGYWRRSSFYRCARPIYGPIRTLAYGYGCTSLSGYRDLWSWCRPYVYDVYSSGLAVSEQRSYDFDPCTVTMAEAWAAVTEQLPLEALDAFACHAQTNPYDGLPKIGYAIAAALLDQDDDAVAIMRDAVAVDVESIQYVPADERLAAVLGGLIDRYELQARSEYGDTEALFMIAALRTIRQEHAAAAYALDVGVTLGDDDESTQTLWGLLEAIQSRDRSVH